MEKIFINARQGDMSDELERLIEAAPHGAEIVFQKGEYYLARKILIKNKKGITLSGNGALIITRFDAVKGFDDYSGAFGFFGCEAVTLQGFAFDTSEPVNSAGKITAIDIAACTFDAEIYKDCRLDGAQTIRAMNSMDKEGSPDYLLSDYGVREYLVLAPKRVRVYCGDGLREALARVGVGTDICFRYGLWSYKTISHAAITFENCKATTVQDIRVYSSAGGMMVVFPRCEDFTLKNYVVKCPEGSHRLMASNVDAVHFLGLGGRLTVENCYFEGLGDDALNIHSTLGTVAAASGDGITPVNERFNIPLEKYWCREGDTVRVYSPDFVQKGSFEVGGYNGKEITVLDPTCDIAVGDTIANESFFAETVVKNCEVRNTRARALLFQTENITVSDCRFYGTSLPAILMAPDAEFWQEAGPVRNVIIENCRFEKCAFPEILGDSAVISVRCSHSGKSVSPAPIHKNIIVRKNTFVGEVKKCTEFVAAEGVEVYGNVMSEK